MAKRTVSMATILMIGGAVLLAAAQTPIMTRYTATADNVGMRDPIRIELFRWSTDEERDQVLAAWTKPAAPVAAPVAAPEPPAAAVDTPPQGDTPAPPAAGRGGAGAGAGRGGGRGTGAPARGAGAPAAPPAAPATAQQQGDNAAPPAGGRGGAAARGGARGAAAPARGAAAPAARGAAGNRGGRGDGAAAAPATPVTPEASLASALGKAPTLGYIWSSEAAGYIVRYAVRMPQPDGGERIVLVTDRRLNPDVWKPTAPTTDYTFSLLELRVNAKGEGEGKVSLTSKVTFDAGAKTVALENYAGAPVVLKGLAKR